MISAIGAAVSGFSAASQRLNVSAQNIANVDSTLTQKDGVTVNKPYVPQKLVQSSDATGGVTASVKPVSPETVSRYDPTNAAADEAGVTQFPNVDVAQELVNTQLSTYTAQANLSVIKAQDRMVKSIIDIIG